MESWKRAGLGGAGAMFVAMGLGRFSYGAMVPALIADGRLSAEQAGWIGGINLAGFFIGAFLSDASRRRWPAPSVLMVCVVLSLVALGASALPWGAAWLGLWRGAVGVTAGLIMVLGVSLTTDAAPPGRRAMAAGLMFSGVGVGIFFSGVLVPWLLAWGIVWAWAGIAVLGGFGVMLARLGWRGFGAVPEGASVREPARPGIGALLSGGPHRRGLAAAYFLFSLGITPHTLYWVDFLVRGLGLGLGQGGAHWAMVGVFAVLGPWAAAWLAHRTDTAWAVVASFVVLGLGIAAPAASAWAPVLWISTMIFGAQPGLTSVTAARARDLAEGETVASLMRVMIMASALGAAVGGIAIPALFAVTARYDLLFGFGGGAMILAALATLPGRKAPARRQDAS